MKIVQFIDSMYTGGAETLVKNYALELKKRNYDISVLCYSTKRNTPNEIQLENNGIKTTYLAEDALKLFKMEKFHDTCFRYLIQILCTIPLFVRYIIKEKPDILHMHMHAIYLFPFIPKRYRKMKAFLTIHSTVEREFKGNIWGWWKKRYLQKHPEITVFALHEQLKRDLENKIGITNVQVLNNCINVEKFARSGVIRKRMREELGISDECFVLGHVGRFIPVKNHKFILQVFEKLLEKLSMCHLLLIGSGEINDEIRGLLQKEIFCDKITILKDRSDVPELLSAMDTFVFPSLYEGFGLAAVEAQAAGLKCVVSERIPEEVCVTDNYFILNLEESVDAWCDVILDRDRRTDKKNRIDVYDVKNVISQLLDFYL